MKLSHHKMAAKGSRNKTVQKSRRIDGSVPKLSVRRIPEGEIRLIQCCVTFDLESRLGSAVAVLGEENCF